MAWACGRNVGRRSDSRCLLKMMWTKKLAVYFFVGFILSSYLGLPLMAIAILGILYVIVLYVESSHKPTQSSAEEEEELFND